MFRRVRKFLALNFDRSFSAGIWAQVVWLTLIVIITFSFLWLIRPDRDLGFRNLVELYMDSGNYTSENGDVFWGLPIYGFIVAVIGSVFFGSALISVMTNMLNVRVDRYRNGDVHYAESNHVVIIGYHKMVPALIRQLAVHSEYKECDVVILTAAVMDDVRHRLHSQLNKKEERKVIFIYGRQTSKEDLTRSCVHTAKRIYLLGEENQYDHDALSIETLQAIADVCEMGKCKGQITCETLIQYQTTYAIFKRQQLNKKVTQYIDFTPFCFEESWAHRILVSGKHCLNNNTEIKYLPLDNGEICIGSKKRVHLVIIGTSKIGVALAKQAALIAHYPNFVTDNIRTKITFIDAQCYSEMLQIVGSNAELFEESEYSYYNIETDPEMKNIVMRKPNKSFLDVEWQFIEGRAESYEVKQWLKDLCSDKNKDEVITIASCLNYAPTSIAIGLYLPREVYDCENVIQILVNQQSTDSIIGILESVKTRYEKVKPFGMLDMCCDLEYDKIVEKAKQVNYIYDYMYNKGEVPDIMGRKSLLDEMWRNVIPAKRWSNIYNASTVEIKLRSMGLDAKHYQEWQLTPKQLDILAAMEHNRWNIEELILGYRAATAEEKDEIAKDVEKEKGNFKKKFIHYDICPFDDLQPDEESKNGNPPRNVNRFDYALSKCLHLLR